MSAPLVEVDPDIADLLDKELGRQRDTLEMIASENFAPRSAPNSPMCNYIPARRPTRPCSPR